MKQSGLLIIGTGLAGYSLAKEWRKLDQHTPLTLITSDQGDFYSKPLLSTALKQGKLLSDLSISTASTMAEQLNARIIINCPVIQIEAESQRVQTKEGWHDYDQLVLALGSVPVQPSFFGHQNPRISAVNDLQAYACFREQLQPQMKVIIIGSGLVGCEFANDLIQTGYVVEVVSAEAYPLAGFVPESVGRAVQSVLTEAGVHWHFNQRVTAVTSLENSVVVRCENDLELMGDQVLSAIGIRANTGLAKMAGLLVNRGIVVDEYLQTNYPKIYALGDCAEHQQSLKQYVAPLLHAARCLAKTLVGEKTACTYPILPVSIKTTLCPVTLVRPESLDLEWCIEGESPNLKALCYDPHHQLKGFALCGAAVKEKIELVKALEQHGL